MRVEQIRGDRLFQADGGGGNFHHLRTLALGHDCGVDACGIGEGLFMGEEHAFIRHRDDIIVKCARGNRFGSLLHEQHAVRVKAVFSRDKAAGLFVLARGEGAATAPVDEHFQPRLAM